MAILNVEAEEKFQPTTADSVITLSAEFGNGQPGGGYVVFLDQELKGINEVAEMGTGDELKDKWMIVGGTIIDKLEETNWTSITITVKEGRKKTTYGPYSKLVPAHLDTVVYLIKILVQ